MLCRVGGLSQSGRLQGRRVVGDGRGGKRNSFHGELIALLLEQGGSQSRRLGGRRSGLRRHAARSADLCRQLDDLLVQTVVLNLHLRQTRQEELVLLFHLDLLVLQLLHFQPLALAGGLGRGAVTKNALNTTLFLFIVGLGSFSGVLLMNFSCIFVV